MFESINNHWRAKPEGDGGIRMLGHREYVGGMWDEIGQLQFDFLLSCGMLPQHYLLDIACGSLRLGVKAIPYLHPEHYLGIEKESGLLDAGVKCELGRAVYDEKKPILFQSSTFEFEKFDNQPDFAIAQSLFTHLTPELINLCFEKLRPVMKPDSRFYATFFEGELPNPDKSHDHDCFMYSRSEMLTFGEHNGFTAHYVGNWNHPRNQVMVEYRLAKTGARRGIICREQEVWPSGTTSIG